MIALSHGQLSYCCRHRWGHGTHYIIWTDQYLIIRLYRHCDCLSGWIKYLSNIHTWTRWRSSRWWSPCHTASEGSASCRKRECFMYVPTTYDMKYAVKQRRDCVSLHVTSTDKEGGAGEMKKYYVRLLRPVFIVFIRLTHSDTSL